MSKAGGKIGAVIVFFVLLFVFAKWGPAINFNTTSQTKGEPFVVTGEGKVFVTPDIAKVTVGIQENGSSLKTIQDNVNKKSKALTDAIEKLGVDKKDIRTVSYNLYPQYDYSTSTTNRIVGYQISTNYEIKVRDFDKVNDVLVTATSVGANAIGSVSFDINDDTEKTKLQEARDLAVTEAKTKAEGLSKAAGITLGKIINISENQGSNEIRPLSAMGLGGGVTLDKTVTAPSVQAGQTEIDVTVSLSYEVR
jgi:hypothetical protein